MRRPLGEQLHRGRTHRRHVQTAKQVNERDVENGPV